MKKGSFRCAQHRYTIHGKEVPNLADEGTTKVLGAIYGVSAEKVAAQITGTLKKQMQRIDEANIGGATKLLIYNDYTIPAWKYRLAVQKEPTVRARELRQLENIATGFLKKWAGVPRSATRAILYGRDGLGLTPFSQAVVATQVEVLEQAAKGDQELRRALPSQVTRHDGREDGFSPIAVAFAIWTGTSSADQKTVDGAQQPQGGRSYAIWLREQEQPSSNGESQGSPSNRKRSGRKDGRDLKANHSRKLYLQTPDSSRIRKACSSATRGTSKKPSKQPS